MEKKLKGYSVIFKFSDIFIIREDQNIEDVFQEYLRNMSYGEMLENLDVVELDKNGDPISSDKVYNKV